MHRAYSILNVKSVDAEKRVLTGIATTPEPDRMGDIVEPLGVQFKNPLPLLFHHDSRSPVGHVTFHKPTEDGIAFTARMATMDEPGKLKDRLDEAWQSVKSGLISGVSIGFRALEEVFMKETMSFRFIKTEVLELSLVTVPANASATIQTIKSLDIGAPALGDTDVSRKPAGATAVSPRSRRERPMKKTISERITELRAHRKTVADRMAAIYQPVLDGTGEMDEAQRTEYQEKKIDLRETDTELEDLEALEQASIMPQAKAIRVTDTDSGSAVRDVKQVGNPDEPKLPPGIEFTRAVICKVYARMMGMSPVDVAKERYPSAGRVQAYLKAAVAGATTQDSTWAAPLVSTPQTLVAEFLEFLRPKTIVGQFGSGSIPSLTRVPFNSRIQSQTSGGSANWVGEAVQKPVTKFDYAAQFLYWSKVAAIAVISDELIRFSTPSAEGRVRDALAKAIIEKLDTDIINPWKAPVAYVSPGGLNNQIAALTPTGTGTADDVRADVEQFVGAFITANVDPTGLVWIMSNTTALALSLMRNSLSQREFPDITMRGGMFEGFPVIASQYAATDGSPNGNMVLLVNASDVFLADDGGVNVDASNQASIEMSSDPANEGSPTTQVVSMYQTNQVAIRAERTINWARARTNAVQWMASVSWSPSATP